MRPVIRAACLFALLATGRPALAADPTSFATAAELKATVAAMAAEMKPGQGFAWRALVRSGSDAAGLEIWKKPGKPAVHPDQGEYGVVIDGAGTLLTGGTMADATVTKPDLTEGSRIDGGTSRTLKPGDVYLIPAGTPHWFGITGERLVLLGIKIPGAAKP